MKIVELTLKERASHIYSQLLLLQRLFVPLSEDDLEWVGTDDKTRDLAYWFGVRALVDNLTEHARVLTAVPFPLSEWQPGDEPDDERWRALTDVERREVLAMVSAYESLIAWSEGMTAAVPPIAARPDRGTASDYLGAERARVGRFRQELRFLERRRGKAEDVETPARSSEVLVMPVPPKFSPNRELRGGDRAPK
jgi:hypothetical protein